MTEASEKAVLVTGAGGGIGLATVKKFIEEGKRVVATDLEEGKLSRINNSNDFFFQQCDITNPASVDKLYQVVSAQGIKIKTLISNAGIYETYPVSETGHSAYRRIMEVNFLSHQLLLSTFINDLIETRGRFILVSSESVKLPVLFQPYMISKIALEAFAVTARQEMALKGVKVIIVRPGAVRTGLLDWMKGVKNPVGNSLFEEEFQKSYQMSTRLAGRPVSPEKAADMLYRAATATKPRKVYNVNHNLLLSLVSIIPNPILEKIILKKLRAKKSR